MPFEPLLPLPKNCATGKFIRRIKRFSVEIEHGDRIITAHCNNTGAMLGLLRPGSEVLFSHAVGKNRKLPYTLERIWVGDGVHGFWAGVNTLYPNRMLKAAFNAGLLDFATGYARMDMEVARGASRLDARLSGGNLPPIWVECKNVTLVEDGVAMFPDAASARAQKHLRELMDIAAGGQRAAMFYLVQRPDAKCFAPADFIDEAYAQLFYRALQSGVEAYAYDVCLDSRGAGLGQPLPIKNCPAID